MEAGSLIISRDASDKAVNNNAYYKVDLSGSITCVETSSSKVYIFGYLQHLWFHKQEELASRFEKKQYNQGFYEQLNGHFSLVIISKTSEKIRLVSNRVGGSRLYFAFEGQNVVISNRLKTMSSGRKNFDSVALRETLEFRWNSGETSLLAGVQLLPSSCYWDINLDQVVNKCPYNYFPVGIINSNSSLKQQASEVDKLLAQSMLEARKPNSKVAVLLSGGVDSSILAAIASQQIDNLVAISHRSESHGNPELPTTIQFAKELGIEHRIIPVSDDEILSAFAETTKIIEQPPRFQSSVILYKLFESMSGEFDQVIYGEAADTLFGRDLIKRYKLRKAKQAKLAGITKKIPFSRQVINLLPRNNKIRQLQNQTSSDYQLSSSILELGDTAQLKINKWAPKQQDLSVLTRLLDPFKGEGISELRLEVAALKSYLLRAACDNHFHEVGALAAHFNIQLISPFVDYRVIDYAAKLDDISYYGKDFVKPVLREIGVGYFTPELMFVPKKGFPAPYKAWMRGVLTPLWDDARKQFDIEFDCNDDVEFQWTMASLGILTEYLNVSLDKKPS